MLSSGTPAPGSATILHQTGGDKRNTECICNCCPDCRTISRQVKLLPNPARYKSSNYVLTHAAGSCRHCREAKTGEGET